jgi:hypothetical protein
VIVCLATQLAAPEFYAANLAIVAWCTAIVLGIDRQLSPRLGSKACHDKKGGHGCRARLSLQEKVCRSCPRQGARVLPKSPSENIPSH